MTTTVKVQYNVARATHICAQIAAGRHPLSIVEQPTDEDRSIGVPGSVQELFAWLHQHPDFQERFFQACQPWGIMLALEALDIADNYAIDGERDPQYAIDRLERQQINSKNWESVNRAKLRIATRQWLAARLDPEHFGDKRTTTHRGDEDNPVTFRNLTDRELQDEIARLQAVTTPTPKELH